MKTEIRLIALGSTRMVGKDTFFSILDDIKPHTFRRYAFADALKEYCSPLCRSIFNKPIHKLEPSEKELFRPILIETGKICRSIDIDYWVKKVVEQISRSENHFPSEHIKDDIPVITDLRFLNEYEYLKSIYGDSMVFVNIKRIGAPEPTYEEKIHAPQLDSLSNYNIVWDTDPSYDSLIPIVTEFYKKYFN
jgi:hypothetical protein